MSGVYPNDTGAEFTNNDINENNDADLNVTQTILKPSINNCVGNILLDTFANTQVSLVNASFMYKNKISLITYHCTDCKHNDL